MSSMTSNAIRAMTRQATQIADLMDKLGSIEQATGEALSAKRRQKPKRRQRNVD